MQMRHYLITRSQSTKPSNEHVVYVYATRKDPSVRTLETPEVLIGSPAPGPGSRWGLLRKRYRTRVKARVRPLQFCSSSSPTLSWTQRPLRPAARGGPAALDVFCRTTRTARVCVCVCVWGGRRGGGEEEDERAGLALLCEHASPPLSDSCASWTVRVLSGTGCRSGTTRRRKTGSRRGRGGRRRGIRRGSFDKVDTIIFWSR